jgi:tetratricopeptide (TPR) repeat protein
MRPVAVCLTAAMLLLGGTVSLDAQSTQAGRRRPSGIPGASAVRAELAAVLLRSGRYAEAAREYRALLARAPESFDYRLGLARALAWGDHPREAERELRQLALRRPGNAAIDSLLRLARVGYEPRAVEAAEWVARDPLYVPYRLALARALAREGMYALALAHFDTLAVAAPSAQLYLERARVRLALRDLTGADSDISASLAAEASADAYLVRGDIYRARGEYGAARSMYDTAAARRTPALESSIDRAFAELAREERPAVFAPVAEGLGWRLREYASADNLGVALSMLQLHRTLALGPETQITLGAEYRQMAERSDERSSDASGYGLTLGAAQAFTAGAFLVRVDGEVGALYHPLAGTVPQGGADVGLWFGPWLGALEVATEAAYPELFTLTALRPPTGEPPLTERKVSVTLAGPVGLLDAGLTWSRTLLSDGNGSLTLQGYARYPLGSKLFAVYSGTAAAWALICGTRAPHHGVE